MDDEFDDLRSVTPRAFAKLYENDWDRPRFDPRDHRNYGDIRMRRETEQDQVQFLYRAVQTMTDRLKKEGCADDAERLDEALRIVDKMIRMGQHARSEASQERSSRYAAENRLKMVGDLSKTIVFVPKWNEDMEAWCAHSVSEKWNCVRDGSGAYFLFHTMEGATLFKLNFAD